ncbi:hypothetical protein HW555_007784 [Spodoptera exigua]|uniref:Uncharacterized protein n=1 Tax=Spodoptera exigua TaxID=7107 RepID=A0A835GEC4_SPOEX|nr:hypothetical protein HW555_007784 [Spodoptera exigua]
MYDSHEISDTVPCIPYTLSTISNGHDFDIKFEEINLEILVAESFNHSLSSTFKNLQKVNGPLSKTIYRMTSNRYQSSRDEGPLERYRRTRNRTIRLACELQNKCTTSDNLINIYLNNISHRWTGAVCPCRVQHHSLSVYFLALVSFLGARSTLVLHAASLSSHEEREEVIIGQSALVFVARARLGGLGARLGGFRARAGQLRALIFEAGALHARDHLEEVVLRLGVRGVLRA